MTEIAAGRRRKYIRRMRWLSLQGLELHHPLKAEELIDPAVIDWTHVQFVHKLNDMLSQQ